MTEQGHPGAARAGLSHGSRGRRIAPRACRCGRAGRDAARPCRGRLVGADAGHRAPRTTTPPAPSCSTPTSTAGGSRPSPPTHRSCSSPRWRHATACDLIAWAQTILLHRELARCEPKTLRYRLLHVAARITRGQRRTRSSRHEHAGTIRTPPNQIPGGNPINEIINSALWPLLKDRG
jgi:hypothetical protein